MSILDDLAEIGALQIEKVEIKGKTFYVRSLDCPQREALQKAAADNSIPDYVVAAHGLVDEAGNPLGPPAEVAARLKALKGTFVSELAAAVFRASALHKDALEDAEKK